ncbi:GNAT family N-acetyltransferase [Maricaulis sp. CAU 1757]
MHDLDICPLDSGGVADAAGWAAGQLQSLPEYISHGEIASGRSPDGVAWAKDLDRLLERDFAACMASGGWVLEARRAGDRVGLCAVYCSDEDGPLVATIEDLIVEAGQRGAGIGGRLLAVAEERSHGIGAEHILLESGLANGPAHAFFERHGYHAVSKVFLKRP